MELLTVNKAAEHLGISPATIRRWIFCRRIGVVKLGRAVRLRSEDIEALAKAGYRPAVNGTK
jgi:excisionase family DNA binding protein